MRRFLFAVAAFTLVASAAGASEPAKKATAESFIDITPIPVPIIADGRLVNYVLLHVRLNLSSSADISKLRDKEPLLRDALVRSVHRSPLTDKADFYRIDEALLKQSIARDVAPVIGARNIASVQVTKQQSTKRMGVARPKT